VLGRDHDLVDRHEPGVLRLALGDDPLGLAAAGVNDLVALLEERDGPAHLGGQLGAQFLQRTDHVSPVKHTVRARHRHRARVLDERDQLIDPIERIHRSHSPVGM